MGIKVPSNLVDWDRMKNYHNKIEVEAIFLDWSQVAQLAREEGKTIEEVLGIDPIPQLSKPPGIEKRFEETLERESLRTGKTKDDIPEEARKNPRAFQAAEERAKRLGVHVSQLFKIDRIILRYSSFDLGSDL